MDKRSPLFSVIVASYNYEKLLPETLESLMAQSYKDFEVLIVDDGSSDGSPAVARDYAARHANVRVLTHPGNVNKGIAATVKLGVDNASGEYVAFCESDDLWTPDHLEKMAAVIREHPDASLLSNGVEMFGDAAQVAARQDYIDMIERRLREGFNFISIAEDVFVNFIPTMSAVMIRRSIMGELDYNPFFPAWFDFWLYRQILVKTRLYHVHDILTLWRQHESANDPARDILLMARRNEFIAASNRLMGLSEKETNKSIYISRWKGCTTDEVNSYQKIKKCFHTPGISNHDAKLLYKSFKYLHPGSRLSGRLLRKYVWHRVLNGWKYRGADKVLKKCRDSYKQRVGHPETFDERDVLLLSHEMSLTGAPRALLSMAVTLKKQGYRPFILSMAGGGMEAEAEAAGIPVLVDPFMQSVRFRNGNLFEEFVATFPTVVFNTLPMILKAIPFGNLKSRKIGWVHEGTSFYKSIGCIPILSEALRALDEVYVVGEYAKKKLYNYTDDRSKIHGLLYGIEEPAERRKEVKRFPDRRKVHFLMAGSVDSRKGADVLAEAMGLIPSRLRNSLVIHVAGKQTDRLIARRLRAMGGGMIDMMGEMSHDSLLECMEETDALLCPSVDDPMPIVCTEAMQMGKTVVTTVNTGTASFIENGVNGFVIPAGDPRALAGVIAGMVENRDKLAETGRKGREIYENYFRISVFEKNVREIFTAKKP